jgi:hypothetical protein
MAGRPPSSIIDIYFADIQTLYCNDGLGFRAIKCKLQERYGVHISHQTIMRRIEDWALEKGQQPPVYHVFRDPQVVAFVKQEWRDNCSHQEILCNISIAMPHIEISDRQLRMLRDENGIRYRRYGDIPLEEEEMAKEAIQEVLKGHGGAYGRHLVQVALRQEGVLVSQYNLRGWQRELDPQGMLYPARAVLAIYFPCPLLIIHMFACISSTQPDYSFIC